MDAIAPKTWYVYTLAYPDGTVFYVGKGIGRRMFAHDREARGSCACKKCEIIRSIWLSGKPVQRRIIFETFSEGEALDYEKETMIQYAQTIVNIQRPVQVHAIPVLIGSSPLTCKRLRKEIGWTAFQTAIAAKVSMSTINRFERDKHSISVLKAYKVLNALSQELGRRIELEDIENE